MRDRYAPLRFAEQVVWELGQVVVLEVQHFQLRPLQPLGQPAHIVPACQQLSEAAAGQQPATQTAASVWRANLLRFQWRCKQLNKLTTPDRRRESRAETMLAALVDEAEDDVHQTTV